MIWALSRCRHKVISGRYEISALRYGYLARFNPVRAPMASVGLRNGGRVELGCWPTLPEAKAACERHAGLGKREAA